MNYRYHYMHLFIIYLAQRSKKILHLRIPNHFSYALNPFGLLHSLAVYPRVSRFILDTDRDRIAILRSTVCL